MIRPQRRSFMPGTSARVNAMQLVRFSSTNRSQSSSRIWSIACGMLKPALLTRMSIVPSARGGVGQAARRPARGHVGGDDLDAPASCRGCRQRRLAARLRGGWKSRRPHPPRQRSWPSPCPAPGCRPSPGPRPERSKSFSIIGVLMPSDRHRNCHCMKCYSLSRDPSTARCTNRIIPHQETSLKSPICWIAPRGVGLGGRGRI